MVQSPQTISRAGEARGVRLRLLPNFELSNHGRRLRLPVTAQRLLVFLAVKERPQHRWAVATRLWADLTDDRSGAALRTTLWQVRRAAPAMIACADSHLRLSPSVEVDLHESVRRTRQLGTDLQVHDGLLDFLSHDLLPDSLDEWVVVERERYRQFRLHALEKLCQRFTEAGEHASAIEAGLRAVAADPLRESAQRVLIEAHIEEGNLSEAVRQYRTYARLLQVELGVEPTTLLTSLLPVAAQTRGVNVNVMHR
ncbi:AfsR/SARP family transcriptional regulator [Streptomyces coerulescens]|uniref:BTAD domain-containing putative transcriptional regulator n=1 Tax=Streptomyces coerulescens TaxID=29304 RepID=A0ABW0CX18_STRCD